jgi:ferredoxin
MRPGSLLCANYHGRMTGSGASTTFEATLESSGQRFPAGADEPLLLAAARAGIAMPSSCRNGTCRTCLRPLRAGRVHYRIEWPGLLPEERNGEWVLPCVAYPQSDVVLGG